MPSELDQAYKRQLERHGNYTTDIAPSSNGGRNSSCIDARDVGPQWVNGYKQAQHDFARGTKQTQFQNVDYQSGYDQAWKDASNGINGRFC